MLAKPTKQPPNNYVNRTLRRHSFGVHLSSFPGARPVTLALGISVKLPLPFSDLTPEEQRWALSDTWCEKCLAPDLGITDPQRFEKNGKEYVSGKCTICGNECITEIICSGPTAK